MRNITHLFKRLLLTLAALSIFSNVKAQRILTGSVKDSQQHPIPYCSIGIKNSKIATVADEDGIFKLVIPDSLAGSNVIFSAIGFIDQHLQSNEFKPGIVITLKEKIYDMAEVDIKASKLKERVIGQQSRPMITFSKMFDQNVPSIEQGNIFEIYDRTLLKAYNFYIMPSSRFSDITLKLNIYTVKDNLPDTNVLHKHITYRTTSTGWQHIDLATHGLNFDGLEKIAVTLQLVAYIPDSNNNFVFGVSAKKTIAKDLLFRYQSQGNWESNAGTFIANLDLKYSNERKKLLQQDKPVIAEKPEITMLASYYRYKQAAAESGYGKNKKGKYIDLGDARIYTEEYGKGEPLVLLHGNNGSIADFYRQIPVFAKHFRVIAIDTRGQGRSTDLSTGAYSYDGFANDLHKVLTMMELKKVNIVGWSDGGNTALSFNLKHPELVNNIVTIGANLSPSGVSDSLLTSFRNQLGAQTLPKNPRLISLMLEQPNIATKRLQEITNPVLVIAGSNDVIKPKHTRLIAANIGKSELQIIQNATHYVPFEKPDQLNKLILDFLNR
ncbi:alpha/beta fold hydrolase [Pedobacter ghigonis]|uniref:alpha/beta fold hydrolase n=1 Tax=Pedobacter ghigonis TaxID=2730403 RepID=UPI00158D2E69|nr:alpha/beta fold hydrolase [Pedobacter ghigonis]